MWVRSRVKAPIMHLGIWAVQSNDKRDQMFGRQRSKSVCGAAKISPITGRALPCWNLHIQLWEQDGAPAQSVFRKKHTQTHTYIYRHR